MKPVLQIAPIALLFAGAVVAVWRNMDPKSDRKGNRSAGGKPKRRFWR